MGAMVVIVVDVVVVGGMSVPCSEMSKSEPTVVVRSSVKMVVTSWLMLYKTSWARVVTCSVVVVICDVEDVVVVGKGVDVGRKLYLFLI